MMEFDEFINRLKEKFDTRWDNIIIDELAEEYKASHIKQCKPKEKN